MRKSLLCLLILLMTVTVFAQIQPVKIVKNANHFLYEVYDYGETIDTSQLWVALYHNEYQIAANESNESPVPGYAREVTIVNLTLDSTYQLAKFMGEEPSECYEVVSPFSRTDIAYDTARVDGLTRYTCHINSNTLEFFVQDFPYDINPLPYYGRFKGLVVCFKRNNQTYLKLAQNEWWKQAGKAPFRDGYAHCQRVTGRELSNLKKQKLVITTRIFDDVQLSWGQKNDHVEGDYRENMPFDSVLHFAGGTLALKRVRLPQLPDHYQTFIELHQRSNGDAYDRTGSVFVIPGAGIDLVPNFFDGINNHPDSLPVFVGKDGQRYQGFIEDVSPLDEYQISSSVYSPPVELMRFFTPFGVGHFNDRVQIDGLEWADETYYKQEVTDLSSELQGDVWIGVWIGNYDGGGHKVTIDIKSYPGSEKWEESPMPDKYVVSLFNTCNVLEMAGQNYGKLFATDSLKTTFFVVGKEKKIRLRYISTGHGGWDGGDEFTPKPNTILIDGKPTFIYTPWREDCGCYRRFNPVSGNFWNGMSSSDYSRSGWCPGTATQPVYFDLSHLEPGTHTITVAIPQGKPLGGSFSHWAVSGVLLYEFDLK
ncbi:MAG: glpgli family protein [Bacteroidales bacterium]|nr:glpgli family protein [Bacteroidales bacterium]